MWLLSHLSEAGDTVKALAHEHESATRERVEILMVDTLEEQQRKV